MPGRREREEDGCRGDMGGLMLVLVVSKRSIRQSLQRRFRHLDPTNVVCPTRPSACARRPTRAGTRADFAIPGIHHLLQPDSAVNRTSPDAEPRPRRLSKLRVRSSAEGELGLAE